MVAGVARETLVALNGEELDSVLLRERWKAAMQGKPSVVAEAVEFLAGYGLYITDSQHRFTLHILCELRETGGRRQPATFTQPWDVNGGERGRSTSLISPLGREVAEKVAQLRSEEDQYTAIRDYAATQAASWEGAVEARPGDLATAAEALRKARIDRATECNLVGVQCVPVQEDWPEGTMQDPR